MLDKENPKQDQIAISVCVKPAYGRYRYGISEYILIDRKWKLKYSYRRRYDSKSEALTRAGNIVRSNLNAGNSAVFIPDLRSGDSFKKTVARYMAAKLGASDV